MDDKTKDRVNGFHGQTVCHEKFSVIWELQEKIIEKSPVGISVYDENGQCIFANDSIGKIIGAPREEVLAQNWHHIESWKKIGLFDKALSAVKEKSVRRHDFKISSTFEKTVALDCHLVPFNKFLFLYVSDIEKHLEIEETLKRARESAEAASRSKSEFLSMMSHEIRTPLNGILGMAQLMLTSTLTPEQREFCELIFSSGEELLRILNNMLEISKMDTGQIRLKEESFDLRLCLEKIFKIFDTNTADKNIRFRWLVESGVPRLIIGDEIRIRQILFNLIGNAVKFTVQGEITVSVISTFQDGENIEMRFSVRDTGIGIPPDKTESIFDAFSQSDSSSSRKYDGAGLGLAICKRMVGLMGGRIWVESSEGTGSEFFFTIRTKKA